jgi:hypothetical protein
MMTFHHSKYFILLIILLSTSITEAQKLGAVKDKYLYVGVPTKEFNAIASFGKQHNMNWCWAACVQMVLNYYDIPVVQEQVVKKALGKLIDRPADPIIMFKALNGWEVDVNGKNVLVSSNFYSTSIKEISAFLSTEKPLIIGLSQQGSKVGHAYVLIGIYYQISWNLKKEIEYIPHSVLLIDPWPGNENIIDICWSEFVERLNVSFKIWVN